LASGKITDAEWHSKVAAVITPAYLAGGNPRAESGYSGTAEQWEQARSLILEAVDRDGSFLDVGCANGHLMESLEAWAAAKGLSLDLYGMDIAPELVELTQKRLPQYAERTYCANALHWMPSRRFDFVRAGLEYVPMARRQAFVTHLLHNVVAPEGRLIVGVFNEEPDDSGAEAPTRETLESMGFKIMGHAERPHRSDPKLQYKVLWLGHRVKGDGNGI
jgi:2-polyprenyl-3-methyl-5-hydroxy-6-metoxy-1,4-benzoquinol methylase